MTDKDYIKSLRIPTHESPLNILMSACLAVGFIAVSTAPGMVLALWMSAWLGPIGLELLLAGLLAPCGVSGYSWWSVVTALAPPTSEGSPPCNAQAVSGQDESRTGNADSSKVSTSPGL